LAYSQCPETILGRPINIKRKEVDMADKIKVVVEPLADPNIRKLARALIRLVEEQNEQPASPPSPTPKGGDGAGS
jgi:hypothetical protein